MVKNATETLIGWFWTSTFLMGLILSTIKGQGPPLDLLKELSQMTPDQVMLKYRTNDAFAQQEPPEPLAMTIYVGPGSGRKPHSKGAGKGRQQQPATGRIQAAPASYRTEPEVPFAENAGCSPTESVVEMPNANASLVVYPAGTKVKRCSGVCGHANLLCKPTQTRTFMRRGLTLIYRNGKLVPVGYQNFTLEEHISCNCECLQKRDECRGNQLYELNNCKCACKNQVQKDTCAPHRVWDYQECRCKCPNVCKSCPSGMYFDENYHCSCVNPYTAQAMARKF